MRSNIILMAAFVTGCAGRFDAVPEHRFPTQLTSEQADSLYESHALKCDDEGACARTDGKRPMRAYAKNGYEPAADVVASSRRKRLVAALIPGATGAFATLLGVAFTSIASNEEKQAVDLAKLGVDPARSLESAESFRTYSTAMFIVGPTLMATGLILGLAMPEADEKEFESEYNRALRSDLDRRTHAAGPPGVVMLPPRAAR